MFVCGGVRTGITPKPASTGFPWSVLSLPLEEEGEEGAVGAGQPESKAQTRQRNLDLMPNVLIFLKNKYWLHPQPPSWPPLPGSTVLSGGWGLGLTRGVRKPIQWLTTSIFLLTSRRDRNRQNTEMPYCTERGLLHHGSCLLGMFTHNTGRGGALVLYGTVCTCVNAFPLSRAASGATEDVTAAAHGEGFPGVGQRLGSQARGRRGGEPQETGRAPGGGSGVPSADLTDFNPM